MTAKPIRADNSPQHVRDNNSERRVAALSAFNKLWAVLTDPNFVGSISIEVPAKKGTVGTMRTKIDELH